MSSCRSHPHEWDHFPYRKAHGSTLASSAMRSQQLVPPRRQDPPGTLTVALPAFRTESSGFLQLINPKSKSELSCHVNLKHQRQMMSVSKKKKLYKLFP